MKRPVLTILALLIFMAVTVGQDSGCGTTTTEQATESPTSSTTTKKRKGKKKPEMTQGQENALESARSYIEIGGMSKKGLIRQLSSDAGEGFSRAEARFAANHVGANWKKEAVESARSYLEMGGMSRERLYEQLTSAAGEGFTPAQARYAVDKVYE